MKRALKSLPVSLTALLGITLAAETVWWESERREAGRWELRWRQQIRQEEQLASFALAPTPENELALVADVARLGREVASRRMGLFPRSDGPLGDVRAAERIDAYFDVAAMVARLRGEASSLNVSVKPDEYFGFAEYTNEGPPASGMALIQQQCIAAEAILGCLFQAQPAALLAVKREQPGPEVAAGERQARNHFAVAPGLSLRRPAQTDTLAFRVEFQGETPALRRFMEALSGTPEMLVVRSVDVVPASGTKPEGPANRSSAFRPLARPTPSHFSVTVEAVRPARLPAVGTP